MSLSSISIMTTGKDFFVFFVLNSGFVVEIDGAFDFPSKFKNLLA